MSFGIFNTLQVIHRIKTLMSHHHQKNVSATLIKNAKNFKIFSCHLGGRDVTDSYKNENVPYHSTTIFFDILPHIHRNYSSFLIFLMKIKESVIFVFVVT